jgi:hypothetical protein
LLSVLRQGAPDLDLPVPEILATYHKDSTLQEKVRALCSDGQTDRVNQLSRRVESILQGPELNELIGSRQFSLEALEAFLADLPGDIRERLGELLGKNALVGQFLGVRPADILSGGYCGGALSPQVTEWTRDPCKHHRVGLLVTALCVHLGKTPDIPQLRSNTGARIGLAHFLNQIGPRWCTPLEESLRLLNLRPISPKSARRNPR